MKLALTILFSLLFGAIMVSGQSDPCHKSSKGTDFWVGFMKNSDYPLSLCGIEQFFLIHYGEITVASEVDADFRIAIGRAEIPYGGTFHVRAHDTLKVKFDPVVMTEAIHLTSNRPVSVYALNFNEYTSDITMIYPASSLGKEYYTMNYRPDNFDHIFFPLFRDRDGGILSNDSNSEFLITATKDQTSVQITPKNNSFSKDGVLHPKDTTFTVFLDKGEQFQLETAIIQHGPEDYEYAEDLTGSHIVSNNPVAVFSGCNWTHIPIFSYKSAGHLYEQMPTLQLWGTRFVAVPFKLKNWDVWSVLAKEDNTVLRIGNRIPVPLSKGFPYEFSLNDDEPSLIQSNYPVMLAQFSASDGGASYDQPSMVIVSPLNHESEKVGFASCEFSPWSNRYQSCGINYFNEKKDTATCQYFINVVARDEAAGKINLDGIPLTFESINGTGYSFVQQNLERGYHLLESTQPGKGFIAWAYNYWGNETRSYSVGFEQELAIAFDHNKSIWCWGDSLSAGDLFDHYKWSPSGDTVPYIFPKKSGWYKVEVSTNDGCYLKDSIRLEVDHPVVNLGNDTLICKSGTALLDAGSPFSSYLWSTGEHTQKITISAPGTYKVNVTDSLGCTVGDEIKLAPLEKPQFDLSSLDTVICGKKGTLDIITDRGNITTERMYDHFLFNGTDVEVPDYGAFAFRVRANDEYSCSADTLVSIRFNETPSVDFSVDSMKCYGYNLTADYIGNADKNLSQFTWYFNGDTVISAAGAHFVEIPLGSGNIGRDLKLTVTDRRCSNYKTIQNIKVIPYLEFSSSVDSGCEPLLVQFHANNREEADIDWDFGDGEIITGTKDPSHLYSLSGSYTVDLKVTSDAGCINEIKAENMISVYPEPHASFSMVEQILSNYRHEVTFTNESSNSSSYLWNFGDESTSVETNPVHLYSKYGLKKILLTAMNQFACSDTTSRTILIEFAKLFPPNAFSPNARDMINREFKPVCDAVSTEGYHLVILSRWNDVLFETKDEIKGWDGRLNNGQMAPAGNYVWILEFTDVLGKVHRQKGTVTLVY